MSALLLLIEDNEQITRGNERFLKREGYEVMTSLTLAAARSLLAQREPDGIVLDVMLPDGSGLDFMKELRRESDVPILLLTGLSTDEDVVRGLSRGGDDYLVKPYDFGVLAARINAMLRRARRVPNKLVKGPLTLDILANRAILGGSDMQLTQKEFAVLLVLAENEGKPLRQEYIYEAVWKQPETDGGTAVKTIVSRIRRKLGAAIPIENDRVDHSYVFFVP